jgi:hypothetical protein
MGVVSLTFNSDFILLFSGGFDHEICVWNPYIGRQEILIYLENCVYKMTQHAAPIVSLNAIEHSR